MEAIELVENEYLLRLDKGESLFKKLKSFCIDKKIYTGTLSAIGALKNSELGFYHLDKKEYHKKVFENEAELLSLEGNISLLNGEPFLHIHVVLGDENFQAFGGHLFSAEIAVTCEVFLRVLPAKLERSLNKTIGLNHLTRCGITHG